MCAMSQSMPSVQLQQMAGGVSSPTSFSSGGRSRRSVGKSAKKLKLFRSRKGGGSSRALPVVGERQDVESISGYSSASTAMNEHGDGLVDSPIVFSEASFGDMRAPRGVFRNVEAKLEEANKKNEFLLQEVKLLSGAVEKVRNDHIRASRKLEHERVRTRELLSAALAVMAAVVIGAVAVVVKSVPQLQLRLSIPSSVSEGTLIVLSIVLMGFGLTRFYGDAMRPSSQKERSQSLDEAESSPRTTSKPREEEDGEESQNQRAPMAVASPPSVRRTPSQVGHVNRKRPSMSAFSNDMKPSQHRAGSIDREDEEDEPYWNTEYNMSHRSWLNFFDGMDVKLEDCDHFKELTDEQKEIFRAFRKQFRESFAQNHEIDHHKPYPLPSDFSILRFLQADKYDTKLALKRLTDTLIWRQNVNLHELVSSPPPKLEQYRKLRVRKYMGKDKVGRPIFVERIGEFITILSTSSGKQLTAREYIACYMYEMGQFITEFRKGAREGKVQWKMVFIADMKGVKLMSAIRSINTLKAFAKEVEIHFPEQAGPIFLINTPSVVHSAWTMAKKFLDPVVIGKIKLTQNVPTQEMLEIIDGEVLFEEYGGFNQSPFPHIMQ